MDQLRRRAAQRPTRRPGEFRARNRTVRLGAVMLTWSLLVAARSPDCRRTLLTLRPLWVSSAVWIADRQQIAAVDTLRNQVLLVSTSGEVEVFPSAAQSLPAEIVEIPSGFLLMRLAGPPQVLDRRFRPVQGVTSTDRRFPQRSLGRVYAWTAAGRDLVGFGFSGALSGRGKLKKPPPASFGSAAPLRDGSKPLGLQPAPPITSSHIDTSQV
jgi:hypothetical protein